MLIICKADIRPPTAPTLGTPSALSSSSISVPMTTASTDVGGVASYAIERATSAEGTYTAVSSAATFPYTDSGLQPSTTYYYRVRATDASGNVGNYSSIVSGTTSAAESGTGQLAAGHWYSSVGTVFESLYTIYPRPDAETASYARHRWAYYDGVNPVEYRVDIGVQYGGWPYWYELIAGPAGMTVGELYGDADYGQVRWTPTGSVTNATVTVRVYDQDGNTLDVTWTVSTSSSTTVFMFADAVNGNDTTGTGAIGAPFRTLQKLFGATEGTTTYPNRIVYMRGGTYPCYTQGAYGFRVYQGRTPTALVTFPGESWQLDMATAGSICAINFTTGANDLYFEGGECVNHPTSTNYYAIRGGEVQHRITLVNMSFPDAYRGSNADNNSSSIYFNSSGGGYRNHIFLKNCSETNRGATGGGGNSWGLTCQFTTQRVLIHGCSDIGNRQQRGCYMKASNAHVEIRECFHQFASGGPVILTGLQADAGLNQGPFLYRHNKLAASSTSGYALAADESQAAAAGSLIKQHYFVRNSCYGRISMNGPATGTHGPYVVAQNVIQAAANSVQRNYANNALGNYVTSTDNVGGTSGWLNTTTLNLEAAHSDVLGTRGAEVG